MEKKELIRKIAIRLMAKNGYHRTKVQDIADAAGVANGTVYYYFKNKEEILGYIYLCEIERNLECMNKFDNKGESALKKLELFIRCYIEEWENNLDVLKVLAQDSFSLQKYNIKYDKYLTKLRDGLIALLEEGYKNGEFKKLNFDLFSRIIMDTFINVIYDYNFRYSDFTDFYTRDTDKEWVIAFILDGIRA